MERDRNWSGMGWPHDALFHCFTCGHRLYGQNAVDHTTREQGRHEDEEACRERDRLIELERQREEARLRRETLPIRKVISFQCAWRGCDNPRREKSIYCSRNCSNKNARARHASRQSPR